MKDEHHAGDCTIYASLINGEPTDGICTCGYGWSLVRNGDYSQMYSRERLETFTKAKRNDINRKQILDSVFAPLNQNT